MCTNLQAMADVLLALMASAHHSTPRSQSSISDLFMVLALKFSRVVLNDDTAATAATLAATRTTLMEMLALEGKSGVAMHWRYTLMANTALLFTLRPGKETIADTVMMAKHALGNTCYELAPLRPLAIATLLLLLKVATPQKVKAREAEVLGGATNFAGMEAWRGYRQRLRLQEDVRRSGPDQALAEAATAAAREAVRAELSGDTISRLMTMLALNHSQSGSGGSAGAFAHTALGGDTLSRAVVALSAARDWPRTKGKASAVQSGAFSLLHVRLFKHLVRLGGSVALEGLRGPLTEACTSADRPHQCLAAEVFAGLLRAGTVPLEEGADWGEWVAPLLIKTLLDTPNELVSEWTAAIRYAVAGHSKEGLPTRRAVLVAIVKPVPPGSPSGLEAKRLSILTAALMEMATRTPDEPFSLALLAELEGLFPHPSRQVHQLTFPSTLPQRSTNVP
jgi:proteasome activator subunit 4